MAEAAPPALQRPAWLACLLLLGALTGAAAVELATRHALYGAQHPAILVPAAPEAKTSASIFESDAKRYVIVGHCCESGDLVTPAPDEPETLLARNLDKGVAVDDLLVIEGAGAYCSGMATKHYNSFPECPEVLLDEAGNLHLIRKKQAVQEIWANEVPYTPKS